MARNATPEQFAAFLGRLADVATVEAPRIEQTALLAGLASYKRRIFTDGKDSKESPIGRVPRPQKFVGDYTANYYERFRKKRGAGSKKTMNITGGTVRNNIQVGRSGGTNSFGFLTEKAGVIADGNTKTHKKQIFALSNREIDKIVDTYVDGIVDLISDEIAKLNAGPGPV